VLRTLQKLNRHSRHSPGPLFCQANALFLGSFIEPINLKFSPSAVQLRVKSGKTMVALASEGHSNSCRSISLVRTQWSNILQPVVLPDLQGKGLVRQRSLSADSLFGYFCGDKSD
jgi:hypothetical protein